MCWPERQFDEAIRLITRSPTGFRTTGIAPGNAQPSPADTLPATGGVSKRRCSRIRVAESGGSATSASGIALVYCLTRRLAGAGDARHATLAAVVGKSGRPPAHCFEVP